MATLKELSKVEERFVGGHRLCAGCGHGISVRMILNAVEDSNVVVGCATGCLEVASTIYPYTAWNCSFIHSAFENAGATLSGVEAAYRALKKQGKIDDNFKFVAFGGDGGTYDIGFQSLSGAMERGHKMVYVCLDNEAYMNTGIQRSSATPMGADTTTSPAGKVVPGKQQPRKDLTAIMAAHNIPYVAQTALSNWQDVHRKAKKAFEAEGPAFINMLSPCPRGWRYNTPDIVEIVKLAIETRFWPLYEVENGKWKLNYKPKKYVPIEEFLKPQGRFRHLFAPGKEEVIKKIQEEVDERWLSLLERCGETPELPPR
ncbi:thiamine pyrophosphate-dependent enzyme [Thermoanaerobacterium sp. DL9XJH110]|jgi:pyruvate ferredoxin oxidoreductase beta subunit|uniref:thiamine pyrophosphate-dependent enzyme n=1 Tax=Thermoanaerobacterium sp. DL9XJH110 TaxID=3386643 RepID=UPI003BB6F2D1